MKVDWDDLALFLHIVDHGGLSGAATASGVSQPTLSRRMTRLEHSLSKRLFLRGKRGYSLTSEGRALVPLARKLQAGAAEVSAWASQDSGPSEVRISTGYWTAIWVAAHLGKVWTPNSLWSPSFITDDAKLDIARREVDIGLRSRKPTQSWLAGQPLRTIEFAVFAGDPRQTGWIITLSGENPTPSQRWAMDQGGQVISRVNDPRQAAQMAQQGLGRVVIPTFAAPLVTGLKQISAPIPALTHREWLVCHHEMRHDPPIRAALNAIVKLTTMT